MRHAFALLMMIVLALPSWAGPSGAEDRPRAGLMWNRSGLPATLPLMVRTMPGHDFVVYLSPDNGGDPVMAGYIHGGTPFRLLVPPGAWRISFAHGREWQGETQLFGKLTEWTVMPDPLTFGAGVSRKRGHVIRLMEQGGRMQIVRAGPVDLCQALTVTSDTILLDDERTDPNRLPTPALRRLDITNDIRTRLCG